MPRRVICDTANCTGCLDVISRTYEELLERGDDDHDAFLLCVNLLEIRYPGHERSYYASCAKRLLGDKRQLFLTV
jgi:hypothetical protein